MVQLVTKPLSMKFNWGFKIVIVYGIFVMGILYMVFLSSKQNRDLVSENYYSEELAYQKVIDQSTRTAALHSKVETLVTKESIDIQFPKEFKQAVIAGNWTLYYAANQDRDFKGDFQTTTASTSVKIPRDVHGNYLIKLTWKINKEEYYYEQPVFLH